MANALYDPGRNHFGIADVNWVGHDIRGWLIDHADYAATYNIATNEYLSTIPDAGKVNGAAGTAVIGRTMVGGIADATDLTFPAVSGDVSEDVVLGRWVTASADSFLLVFIDQATGLPVTPNTGDIVVRWADTGNKIFKL
jgi:hypothetical protein